MESDPILTRDEIDALLSAIHPPEDAGPDLHRWDFRRPRRLRAADLDRLRDLHKPHLEAAGRAFGTWLKAPVQARLLGATESTIGEFLEGRPPECLLARAGDVLVDPSPAVAFALVERALGGGRLTRPPERALRDLESDLVSPAIADVIAALSAPWTPAPAGSVRWAEAEALARETWPEGSCAVIGLEMLSEGLLGDLLIAVPIARFERVIARARGGDPAVPPGVEIEIAARFPPASLKLGELRRLAPGDLLVWNGEAAPEITLEVSGRPRFSGRPGILDGKIAVEILRTSNSEAVAAPLVRQSGGAESPGAPEVPLELRAVLAERPIARRDLAALRPGALFEFAAPVDGPVELRLGRSLVATGAPVRTGDRLAVQIESASGAPLL